MANDITVDPVDLPILPKDIFRLLALRSIIETNSLLDRLINNFDTISNGIQMTARLKRQFPFNYVHDPKIVKQTKPAEMTERQLCAANNAFFADRLFTGIGKVLDYEMPLDDKKDSAFGKVDLVSQIDDELILLEVKKCVSNEHPLRAMFEIFTFWKMLSDTDGGFDKFITAYIGSKAYKARGKTLQKPRIVTPGLLLCNSDEKGCIWKTLLETRAKDRSGELYKKFLGPAIGMRIFVYEKDNLNITEKTHDLKRILEMN